MLFRKRVSGWATKFYESKAGLWFPTFGLVVPKYRNVFGVLNGEQGKRIIPASNLITDAGDLHYAQRIVSESLTNAFGIHEMATATPTHAKANHRGTAGWTFVSGSQKATDGTYPLRNDGDTNNPGPVTTDMVTHRVSYTKADFNANGIAGGIITNTSPGASEPILTGYDFAATFNKTADDTLTVYVNHTANGV